MFRAVKQLAAFLLVLVSVVACSTPGPAIENLPLGSGLIQSSKFIQTFDEVPSGLAEASRLGQSFPSSDFYTTGLYLPPDTELTLHLTFVKQGSGTPRLLIGTYSRYEGKWNPTEIDLKEGTQTIRGSGKGGLMYIRYHAESDTKSTGVIDIEFKDGSVSAPHFKLGESDNLQWQYQLDNKKESPDVILESEMGMIVVSRKQALKFRNEDQERLLSLFDDVYQSEAAISGLSDSSPAHQNNHHKVLLTETDMENTYMAATWYRTWYHRQTIHHILSVDGFQYDGWGPWHEIGHMHQQEAWTWKEVEEVTVNIYALAAERVIGNGRSRLNRDNVWAETAVYLSLPDQKRDFNSDDTGLFVRLAMYQQLWLAFGDEFYHQLHKITREHPPRNETREEKMRYFMLKASEISGVDLGEFFRKWGFKVQESIYDEITALNLPLPSMDVTKLTDDPEFEFPEEQWAEVVDFSSEEISGEGILNGRADRVVDGIKGTYWHSGWENEPTDYPHYLTVRLHESIAASEFEFTQRSNGLRHVKDIEILISNDSVNWERLGDFELDQITTPQTITLPEERVFRYFKIVMKSSHDGYPFAAMDEIRVY